MECDLTISELFQAYYDCRKTKRNTWNALQFEQNLERNLMDLYYELISGEYEPGRSIMFVVTRPKPREVWAANFRDRIVHHVLYNRYADAFYRSFIHDSYACIPDKGTLRASNRVQHFIRSATENHTKQAWFLKADVANFFVSIDKSILDRLLMEKIKDPWWVALTRTILHKDPRENVFIKSTPEMLALVPRHKSLLNAPDGFGLPIGNLSSQFFANVYMNPLDQFAKHKLKTKYYARYVDDIIVLDQNGSRLHEVYQELCKFAKNNLGITFHNNKKEINTVDKGINFVGYIVRPFSKYIRRSTINNITVEPDADFETTRSSINSYFGMLRHANTYKERKRIATSMRPLGYSFNKNLTKMITTGKL